MEESSSNSGGGDEDDVRRSEWEVISLSLSSHSLAASTTFETAAGTGQEEIGGEAVDVGFQSDYSFISSSSSSSPELQQQTVFSSDDDGDDDGESLMVQFDLDSDKKRIPLGSSSSPELPPPKGLSQEQVALAVATTDDDELRPESDYVKEEHFSHVSSCTSHMQEELLQMSWSEPLPSGIGHAVVDYGDEHEIGNKSLSYALAPAAKAGSHPDFGQTGRGSLLGSSCLSTPSSSPIILSRSSSLQLLLGEELCHNQVGEGNESGGVAATACLFENAEEEQQQQQVWSSAGGLGRTNLEFEFPDSDADMQNVELEKRKSSATLLGDGFYEQHTCETWWKWCRRILWCMQAQQATALWSIALAAAVMGLVILGHQWQHERCQNQQLQLQLCSKDEKISHLTYQVVRLREAMLGHRRVPVLRSSSVYHTF
ncbi:hypothetical protein CY35_01G037800 [Sphagnum magellanicum]|nr:hypothetical protein CY35_01G037800 [Sphagnum magellanicum]KAH9574104.1 hypothetical protein CY35_01G037800 [Sphagnum magellanicum]